MKVLGIGVNTKIEEIKESSNNDLYNAVGGRVYRGRAPESFTMPLVIFDMLIVSDPMLDEEDLRI